MVPGRDWKVCLGMMGSSKLCLMRVLCKLIRLKLCTASMLATLVVILNGIWGSWTDVLLSSAKPSHT